MGEVTLRLVTPGGYADVWEIREGNLRLVLTQSELTQLAHLLPCPGGPDYPCYQAGYEAGLEAKREPLSGITWEEGRDRLWAK